jgi:hypothetical protein
MDEFTYTVRPVPAVEQDALVDFFEDLGPVTQAEGYSFDLTPAGNFVSETGITATSGFLGWFTEDVDYTINKASGIFDTAGLEDGDYVLTAAFEYDTDKYAVTTVSVSVLTLEDAVEAVMATVKPANILDNGEVTDAEFVLVDQAVDAGVLGVTLVWNVIEDENGVVTSGTLASSTAINSGIDVTDIVVRRTRQTEKVILQATVETLLGATLVDTETFEFRAIPADKELVEYRLAMILDELDSTTFAEFTAVGSGIIADLDTVVAAGDFLYDTVELSWESDNAAVVVDTDAAEHVVMGTVASGTYETAVLTVTAMVDIDGDGEVDGDADAMYEGEITVVVFAN